MPYIIETNRLVFTASETPNGEHSAHGVTTRTAVATLDEARKAAANAVGHAARGAHAYWFAQRNEASRIPESGGTIGPLPDGTVIEVRHVTWHDVIDGAGGGFPLLPDNDSDRAAVLAAFNAA